MKKLFLMILLISAMFAAVSCSCSGNASKAPDTVSEPVEAEMQDDSCEVCDSTAVRDSSLRR